MVMCAVEQLSALAALARVRLYVSARDTFVLVIADFHVIDCSTKVMACRTRANIFVAMGTS